MLLMNSVFKIFLILLSLLFIGSIIALIYVELGSKGLEKLYKKLEEKFQDYIDEMDIAMYQEGDKTYMIISTSYNQQYLIDYDEDTRHFKVYLRVLQDNGWLSWFLLSETNRYEEILNAFELVEIEEEDENVQ